MKFFYLNKYRNSVSNNTVTEAKTNDLGPCFKIKPVKIEHSSHNYQIMRTAVN